ncbi:MAG: PQQ-binding-like beta-propeller repeat protein [Halobacteriaceae archaeon]
MQPSRRTVLRAAGVAGAGALAGCVGQFVPGGTDRPPAYLQWLVRPGRIVAPGEYRIAVIRPSAVANPARRFGPLVPSLPAMPLEFAAAERLIVGGGAVIVTGEFTQAAVVEAYRNAGYTYRRGVGPFWILDDGDRTTPIVAGADGTLVAAWPTSRETAGGVIDTLIYGYRADEGWLDSRPALTSFARTVGTPPAVVVDLGAQSGGVPQGAFEGVRARAITHAFDPPRREYAFLFDRGSHDTGTLPTEAVEVWADSATAFEDPTVTTDGATVTVGGRPPDVEYVATTVPAAASVWNGHAADARRSASLPLGNTPSTPVRARWLFTPGDRETRGDDDSTPRSPFEGAHESSGTSGSEAVGLPAVTERRLYVTADDCYALDPRDGSITWRANLAYAAGTPVLDQNRRRVYVNGTPRVESPHGVHALDAATGALDWSFTVPQGPVATMVPTSEHLFVGTESPHLSHPINDDEPSATGPVGLFAVRLDDGTEAWRRASTETRGITALAALEEGVIAVLAGTKGVVTAYNADGSVRWRQRLPEVDPDAVALTEATAVVSGANGVVALALADGSVRWRHTPPRTMRVTGIALAGDRAYVGAARPPYEIQPEEDGGSVRALRLDDGATVWRTGLVRRVTARPAVVGDRVYGTAGGGALVAFDRSSGTRTWTLYLAGSVGPVVAAGGSLYAPSATTALAAFGTAWQPGTQLRVVSQRG